MLKNLLLTILAAGVTLGVGYADQSNVQANVKVTIPVDKTSPTNGKQMFTSYCAPCHGVDGKGHGPVATALKSPPTDLTGLSRKNHGSFPDTHIVAVLQFGAEVPSHGTATMPVWGPILGKMSMLNSQDKQLRICNLSRYIESMQSR